MVYEVGDVLTLSNNLTYVVVTTLQYNGKNYIYLVNEVDNSDVMFCEYLEKEFEKVSEPELIAKLLELIAPEMKQIVEASDIVQ